MEKSQKDKMITYWKQGAKRSLGLANDVLEKKHYDHALFCGHLSLEKLLKAKAVEITDKYAPHSHDLLYLAGLAKVDLDTKQQKFLTQVNTFNIEGRYPEENRTYGFAVILSQQAKNPTRSVALSSSEGSPRINQRDPSGWCPQDDGWCRQILRAGAVGFFGLVPSE